MIVLVEKAVRAALLSLVAFGAIALTQASARAEIEFCPAGLNGLHPLQAAKGEPAALFSYTLTALGPRTVTGQLAVQTDRGWFTAPVPSSLLTRHESHYVSRLQDFTRVDFVSPLLYVQFPEAIKIQNVWIRSARAIGDGEFGWEAQGTVPCNPPGEARSVTFAPIPDLKVSSKTSIDYTVLPAPGSIVPQAVASTPLESTDCPKPFVSATTVHVVSPEYPYAFSRPSGVSIIAVAIEGNGTLRDAWVWGSSGDAGYDAAALASAARTTYSGATAFCRPVAQTFLFRARFTGR